MSPEERKVKEEPMAKLDSKKKAKREYDGRKCFKCREPGWNPEHGKTCKARKRECRGCHKIGHYEKLCPKEKRDQSPCRRRRE